MFEHPLHHWVGHRDVPVNTLLEAHFDRSQSASENADADFDASVGLRIVSRRCFRAGLLDMAAVDLYHRQSCFDEYLNGGFAVGHGPNMARAGIGG